MVDNRPLPDRKVVLFGMKEGMLQGKRGYVAEKKTAHCGKNCSTRQLELQHIAPPYALRCRKRPCPSVHKDRPRHCGTRPERSRHEPQMLLSSPHLEGRHFGRFGKRVYLCANEFPRS